MYNFLKTEISGKNIIRVPDKIFVHKYEDDKLFLF